ncbi:MAG: hypothetical protein J2P45_15200 [Candidatus Dormibacteraeota bacterium]|nr:hypothetical protein [Candidatus Dormibacteraeota bacterium]
MHRGRDPGTGRPVTVRLLWQRPDGPVQAGLLAAKLTAASRLQHPNLVPVLDWGEAAGVPYVVTDDPGSERLANLRPPDWRGTIAMLQGLAAGIDHAHSVGLAHGAIQPSSVVLSPNGTPGLTDFGIGTLLPEPPTPAGDVLAFSQMARTLLVEATDGSRLPRSATAALARGVTPDPERRWSSCGELVAALESAAPAAPGRGPGRVRVLVGVGLIAVLAASGAVVAAVRAHQAGPAVPLAAAPARESDGKESPAPTPRPSAAPSMSPSPAPTPTAAPTPTPTPLPVVTVTLSTATATRGGNLTVSGKGFDPRQQYVIELLQGGMAWHVGPMTPGADGTFSNTIQIPAGAAAGTATVAGCLYIANVGATTDCSNQMVTLQ